MDQVDLLRLCTLQRISGLRLDESSFLQVQSELFQEHKKDLLLSAKRCCQERKPVGNMG